MSARCREFTGTVTAAAIIAAMLMVPAMWAASAAVTPRIQVTPNEAGRRVDVTVDGKPFTSYIYPTS
ncbi:MAG: hypothetical protein LC753_17585, partial [Acidobacteria bacterium]|nr:hypothetical protein [Acidobacteriota bacterium]